MWNAVGLQPHTLLQCSSIIYLGDIMSELKKNVGTYTYIFFQKLFSFFSYFEEKLYQDKKYSRIPNAKEFCSKFISSQTQFYKVHLCTR